MKTSPRSRAWFAAVLIFLLGFGAGTAATLIIGARVIRNALRAPASAPAFIDRAMERSLSNFESKLDLSPEESARMKAEFRVLADNIKHIRLEAVKQFIAESNAAMERISATLPPEKQAAFRKLADERFTQLGLTPLPSAAK